MELQGAVQGCLKDPTKLPQLLKQSNKSVDPPSPADCFDCNICLGHATDPVVTLCGHLYCWPCIYEWLQHESTSPQHCRVCKTCISENTLVPLYGRGGSSDAEGSVRKLNIPKRPSAHQDRAATINPDSVLREDPYANAPSIRRRRQQNQYHHDHYYPYYNGYPSRGSMTPAAPHPTRGLHSTSGGVLGGTVALLFPWAFRNHQGPGTYYSSPYHLMTSGNNPRLRRQEMQVERSLHQLWVFLLCCALLGFFLF